MLSNGLQLSIKINEILELTAGSIDGILEMVKLGTINTDRLYEILMLTEGKTEEIIKMMELSHGNTDEF